MPPRSPLPDRFGLSAAWVQTPDRGQPGRHDWPSMGTWLQSRLDRVDVRALLAADRFVYADGRPVGEDDAYRPAVFVWFHRDLPDEAEVPGRVEIVHRDERLVVVDKPAFLSSIPRGRHVRQSVVARLRHELGLPELSTLHRLDRITSGLLMLATERRWRGPYQSLFQHDQVRKTYRALAPVRSDLDLPVVVRNHLLKSRDQAQTELVDDAPVNAETLVELEQVLDSGLGVYRLAPRTGRTHQLRKHLALLGIPIVDDPLYPVVRGTQIDDFSRPLQLLAAELTFTDPVDGTERRFTSGLRLPLAAQSS